jgi:hypothetical protein
VSGLTNLLLANTRSYATKRGTKVVRGKISMYPMKQSMLTSLMVTGKVPVPTLVMSVTSSMRILASVCLSRVSQHLHQNPVHPPPPGGLRPFLHLPQPSTLYSHQKILIRFCPIAIRFCWLTKSLSTKKER